MRAANLRAFRRATAALACEGSASDARDRLVIVPTRAAAALVVRTIEDDLLDGTETATILPDIVTPGELIARLAARLPPGPPTLSAAEREALLGVACRMANDSGAPAPFRLRPGLLVEILAFYDALRRNQKDLDTFERLALGMLEPGAVDDRGAERLVRQTRFLVAAFRRFEQICAEHGVDEHGTRARLVAEEPLRPYRHLVLAVTDRAFDPHGLHAADWDLITRIPRLERIDVLVTDTVLAGALHEHLHQVLPGIEEVRADDGDERAPTLVIPPGGTLVHVARDREDEVAGFARRVKHAVRGGRLAALDRAALVVHKPLPYVYAAREVFRSAALASQTFDALPLAAEPFAAALDLVCTAVSADFARGRAVALLRSPHFTWLVPRGDGAPKGAPYERQADDDRAVAHDGAPQGAPYDRRADEGRAVAHDGAPEGSPYDRREDEGRAVAQDGAPEGASYDRREVEGRAVAHDGALEGASYDRREVEGRAVAHDGALEGAPYDRRPFRGAAHAEHDPATELRPEDVTALDRALAESGYLGGLEALDRQLASWLDANAGRSMSDRVRRAGDVLRAIARELQPLQADAPIAHQLQVLAAFLRNHENVTPLADDGMQARHLRARGAIFATLAELRDAYARFDDTATPFDDVAALVRRWIEDQTFAPRTGSDGLHIVDAESARFGEFDTVHLAGLVDGEWPDHPRRSVFYSPAVLHELGWPADALRRDAARAAFADLLRLPAEWLTVSTFSLEADAIVSPSIFVDEVEAAGLDAVEEETPAHRIFELEGLAIDPIDIEQVPEAIRDWAAHRLESPPHGDARFRGNTQAYAAPAYSLSALERYQDCPFKFFATDVLRLDEVPEDESVLSPKARGRFIHEVFQRFFAAWDAAGGGAITADTHDQARRLFVEVAEPLLQRLPPSDATLERTRLFGSGISVGIADVVLGIETTRPGSVVDRWLEYRLDGEFSLGFADGRRVGLRGVADRIDLLAGRRLRVVDYKSGSAPNTRRALQVPIYALCAQERLTARDAQPWTIEDASYVALSGKRALAAVVKAGAADAEEPLRAARQRLLDVLDGIGRGEFPPRPHDLMICKWCSHAAVCRKDYVGDDL